VNNPMKTAFNALDTLWKSYNFEKLVSFMDASLIKNMRYEIDGMTFNVSETIENSHELNVDFLDCGEVDNRVNFTLVQNGQEMAIDTSERSIDDYLAGRFDTEVVKKLLSQVLQDNMQTFCNVQVMIIRANELHQKQAEKEAKTKAKTVKQKEDSEDSTPYVIYGAPREKFIPKILGDNIMNLHTFKTMKDNREVYIYKNGVYYPEGESKIESLANEILGNEATDARVKETIIYIKRSTFVDRKDFNSDENLHILNLENGLLNVNTGELKSHTPDFLSTVRIHITYDPKAQCPQINKFLNDVVTESRKEKDVTTLTEMAASMLTPVVLNKAYLLTGAKAQNGKSTYIEIIQKMLGEENYSSVPLNELQSDKFSSSELFGMLGNIAAELPSAMIEETDKFNGLVTGKELIRAQKKYGQPFKFKNKAKLLFSANKPPVVSTEANQRSYFRRWQLVDFPNIFNAEHGNEDRFIIEKLTTPEELSGFLNFMLPYLKKLLETKSFTYESSADDVREAYLAVSNPVQAFIENCIVFVDDAFVVPYILKKDILKAFKLFCNYHGANVNWEQGYLTNKLNNDKHHDFKGREYKFWRHPLIHMNAYKKIIFSDKLINMFPEERFNVYDEDCNIIENPAGMTASMADRAEALGRVPKVIKGGIRFNKNNDTPVMVTKIETPIEEPVNDITFDNIKALDECLSELSESKKATSE